MNESQTIAPPATLAQTLTDFSGRDASGRPVSEETGLTPVYWFNQRFPPLAELHGEAVNEYVNDKGILLVRGINEDYLAATLGEAGNPEAPTVYLPAEGRFYTYSPAEGIYLHQLEESLLQRVSVMLLECGRACCGTSCDTTALQFRFRNTANLRGVIAKARAILSVDGDYFASNLTEYIPCANGMLRLQDKMLLPFNPSYRRRNKLAVAFNPSAQCPIFLDTLMRPALDDEDLDLLQRWCGLALIGENYSQKIVLLTGTPGGGKGTFINVLTGIIGESNLAELRPQLLNERFEHSQYLGKTLLYGPDVQENFLNFNGASRLKSLTGGDPLTLEFKGSNERPSIVGRFNVVVTCNSRLTVHLEGDKDAWRRRLVIVPYDKPKPVQAITGLAGQIIQSEGSGVLNWMLGGLDRLKAEGWQLAMNQRQDKLVENLLLESDGLTMFAQEELERAAAAKMTVEHCFEAYVNFCSQRGWAPLTRKQFLEQIGDAVTREYGLTARHDIKYGKGKAQRGWIGIQLRGEMSEPEPEPEPPELPLSESRTARTPLRNS